MSNTQKSVFWPKQHNQFITKTSHEQEQIILYSVLSMHLFIIFFYEVQHIVFCNINVNKSQETIL